MPKKKDESARLSRRRQKLLRAVLESHGGVAKTRYRAQRQRNKGAVFCAWVFVVVLILLISSMLYEYFL